MSLQVSRRFIEEAKNRVILDEFLAKELVASGYGGVDMTKSPLGTRVTIYAMRPGLVIGRRGENIRTLSKTLEDKFKLSNPQIAVAEIEVPELNPRIMASRVASALERGVHFRKAGFWVLNSITGVGSPGVEIVIRGKLRSMRARYEKFRYGFFPKAGDPAIRYVRKAVVHAKLKQGMLGIKVKIFPPDVSLPDDIRIKDAQPVKEVEVTGSEILEKEKVDNNKDE